MQIYRYSLQPPHQGLEATIRMPRGAQILTAQVKEGVPCVWAMVDPEQPLEDRTLLVLPTGINVPSEWRVMRYVDTFQITDKKGTLCFHIFEKTID